MIILTTVTLTSSNNALPDDGDWTETCRSCFNANFNILFKAFLLYINWYIRNSDNTIEQFTKHFISFANSCVFRQHGFTIRELRTATVRSSNTQFSRYSPTLPSYKLPKALQCPQLQITHQSYSYSHSCSTTAQLWASYVAHSKSFILRGLCTQTAVFSVWSKGYIVYSQDMYKAH